MPRAGDREAVSTHVAAPAATVRALVRDVGRMAAWSPEVLRVRWSGWGPHDVSADLVGRRFRGWSRTWFVLWVRTCEVLVDAPDAFAWVTLPTWWNGDATLWHIAITRAGEGCVVTLSYEVLADAPWFIRTGGVVTGRVRRLPSNLGATVAAIARAAEADPTRSSAQSGRGSRPRSIRSSAVRSRESS